MLLLLLTLLQPQQPRISRVVIAGAVLVFVAGVSLLVYFYRRYKRIEKEPEEDWDLSRRSLFVNVAPPAQKSEETGSAVSTEVSAPVPERPPIVAGATREFASGVELAESTSSPITEPATKPPLETTPLQGFAPPSLEAESSRVPRPTEVLASPTPQQTTIASPTEPAAFEDEVWEELELEEEPEIADDDSSKTAALHSAQPPSTARVDERSHREPFEAPNVGHIQAPEPDEAPGTEPLKPQEQAAATQQLRSTPPPRPEPASEDLDKNRQALGTGLFGSLPRSSSSAAPVEPPRVASETREVVAADTAAVRTRGSSDGGGRARKAPAGSVLGLPAEPSSGPLILGDNVRRSSDVGIDALSNYGKDVGPKGGRGGTIALLVVVGLLGAAVLLYFLVPSVHSKVQSFVGQLRGTEAQAAREAAMKPKVQIIPSTKLEVNKNLVTARGAIDNISDEPLENLSIEVSLQRGADKPPEIRTVSVVPNPLPPAPAQRGTFEFEYDGKRDTGFSGYKITRVFSNGTEIKFRAPGK